MIRNFILIAIRNIKNKPIYSVINITGLAVGLASVLIILSYIKLETSYDKFHLEHDQIYRIVMDWNEQQVSTAMVHAPLADGIKDDIAGIEQVVRVYPHFQSVHIGKNETEKIKVNNFLFADSSFFELFNFNIIGGTLEDALTDPFSIVITKETAFQVYGSTDVIDQQLRYEDEDQAHFFNIVAVIEDIPQNSHFHFGMISSFNSLKEVVPYYNNWHHPPLYTYVKLYRNTTASQVLPQIQKSFDSSGRKSPDDKREFHLQKLTDIHLHSDLQNEWESNSSYLFIRMFLVIAAFILLMASINFMNLTTAQASQRAKEIGIRKVQGSTKNQLFNQFMSETFAIVLIAFLLALGIAELGLITLFNDIIGKELSISNLFDGINVGIAFIGLILLGFISGFYPSLYLSKLKPISIFRSKSNEGGKKGLSLRKLLVIFQFFIAAVLMLGTLVVIQQTQLMRNKNLGFDKEHIVSVKMPDRYAQKNYSAFANELLDDSNVLDACLSSTLPGKDGFYSFDILPEGKNETSTMKTLGVDEGFVNTYSVKIIEGRDFSKDVLSDQRDAVILNQAAVKLFGWKEPLGKEIKLTIHTNRADERNTKVIGVVENFNYQSLYHQVEPLVIYINKHPYYSDYVSVKFTSGSLSNSIDILKNAWSKFHPDKPLDFIFLTDALNQLYNNELKRSKIFAIFTVLSILISCLGLFGLSAFSMQQRVKEIAIRKVLGSSTFNLLNLLSKEYLVLIIIANLIALPLSWSFSDYWLDNFIYKTSLDSWMFLIVLLIIVLITLISIGYHVLKVATINPVESLQSE